MRRLTALFDVSRAFLTPGLVSMLAVACALARPDSARQDIAQDETAGLAPFYLDDSSTRAPDSDSSAQALDSDSPARAGDPLSLAIAEMEGDRYEHATAYLRMGASDGDLRCAYVLGLLTLEGKGTERDTALAADLLRKVARAGLPSAQATLGLLYASGEGVEKDEEMAAEWYRKAARGGDPMGQAARGAVEFLGVGTPKDEVRGYMWTILAAEQDHDGAYWNLDAMASRLTTAQRLRAYAMADAFTPRSMPEEGHFETKSLVRHFQRLIKERLDGCPQKSKCGF